MLFQNASSKFYFVKFSSCLTAIFASDVEFVCLFIIFVIYFNVNAINAKLSVAACDKTLGDFFSILEDLIKIQL